VSLVWCRYHHDGSETLEDVIQLTATDGTNPVDFELLVQVGVLRHSITRITIFKGAPTCYIGRHETTPPIGETRAIACIPSDWLICCHPGDLLIKR